MSLNKRPSKLCSLRFARQPCSAAAFRKWPRRTEHQDDSGQRRELILLLRAVPASRSRSKTSSIRTPHPPHSAAALRS